MDDAALVPSALTVRARPLTDRQTAWVLAYLGEARLNATEAARIVGYADPGQSGYENKKNPACVAYIDAFLRERAPSPAEVLYLLTELAMAPLAPFMQRLDPAFTDPVTGEQYPALLKLDSSTKLRA